MELKELKAFEYKRDPVIVDVCGLFRDSCHFRKHSHERWLFDCYASNEKQEKGHIGISGCSGMFSSQKWKEVIVFVEKHSQDAFCQVTAQRTVWTPNDNGRSGSEKHFTVFLRCIGCGVHQSLVKPPGECV